MLSVDMNVGMTVIVMTMAGTAWTIPMTAVTGIVFVKPTTGIPNTTTTITTTLTIGNLVVATNVNMIQTAMTMDTTV